MRAIFENPISNLVKNKFKTSSICFSDEQEIQDDLKQSLRDRLQKFMSNDWLPEDAEGHNLISTQEFYMEPDWTRTVMGGLEEKHVSMEKLCDIFDIYEDKSRIIAEGISFDLPSVNTFIEVPKIEIESQY